MKKGGEKGGEEGKKKGGRWAMCLNELLWKAHKSGLSVDGSREMLVASLKAIFCSDQSPTITFYYKLHNPWVLRRNQYPRTANFD